MIKLLRKAVDFMKNTGKYLDEDDLHYYPGPLTSAEFSDLFKYLEKITNGMDDFHFHDNGHNFPEYRAMIEFEGFKFIWRLLVGQGSACQLLPENNDIVHGEWNKTIYKITSVS